MKFNRGQFHSAVRPIIEVEDIGVLQSQVDGLNQLLDFIEGDTRFDGMDRRVAIAIIAYFLATVALECTIKMKIGNRNYYVKSFHPVEEMGGTAYLNRLYDTRTDLGNSKERDGDGAKFAGDGYVQNTGKSNAEKSGRRLAGTIISYDDVAGSDNRVVAAFTRLGGSRTESITIDESTFVVQHELLRVPKISYLDAVDGMLTGRYTGRKISDYINVREVDYYNARRVINAITSKNQHVAAEIMHTAEKFAVALTSALQPAQLVVNATIPITANPTTALNSFTKISDYAAGDDTPLELNVSGSAVEPSAPILAAGITSDEETAQNNAEAANSSNQFVAFIPHIDTAKSWAKRAIAALLTGNVAASYLGLPIEIRYGLIGLLFLVVIGTIVIFAKYHQQIFAYVTAMNMPMAQSAKLVAVLPDKKNKK